MRLNQITEHTAIAHDYAYMLRTSDTFEQLLQNILDWEELVPRACEIIRHFSTDEFMYFRRLVNVAVLLPPSAMENPPKDDATFNPKFSEPIYPMPLKIIYQLSRQRSCSQATALDICLTIGILHKINGKIYREKYI